MAKVMLVEDDNNLRQIYQDRLAAEGYTVVAAQDGEEALAMAVKERPDLIIADIMMPKVSGFDMLDILRSTPETRDTKIIMMTALSQAEDKTRAEKLGADKYLVKSQVTLEDVVKVAGDMLNAQKSSTDNAVSSMTGSTPASPAAVPTPANAPVTTPMAVQPAPTPEPAAVPAEPPAQATAPPTPTPAPDPTPVQPMASTITDDNTNSDDASTPVSTLADEPETPQPALEPAEPIETKIPVEEPKAAPKPTEDEPSAIPITVTTPEDTKGEDSSPAVEEKPFAPAPQMGESVVPATESEPTSDKAEQAENKAQELSEPTAKEEATVDEQIDNVIANNPTLTTSAEPEKSDKPTATPDEKPEPVEPTAEETTTADESKDEVSAPSDEASKKMEDAVNDLVSSAGSDTAKIEEKPGRPSASYVSDKSTDDDKPKLAMTHERKIEPMGDVQSAAPNLNELLAKEASNTDLTPPPVNSVIQPGGGSITDSTSSTSKPASGATDPGSISL